MMIVRLSGHNPNSCQSANGHSMPQKLIVALNEL